MSETICKCGKFTAPFAIPHNDGSQDTHTIVGCSTRATPPLAPPSETAVRDIHAEYAFAVLCASSLSSARDNCERIAKKYRALASSPSVEREAQPNNALYWVEESITRLEQRTTPLSDVISALTIARAEIRNASPSPSAPEPDFVPDGTILATLHPVTLPDLYASPSVGRAGEAGTLVSENDDPFIALEAMDKEGINRDFFTGLGETKVLVEIRAGNALIFSRTFTPTQFASLRSAAPQRGEVTEERLARVLFARDNAPMQGDLQPEVDDWEDATEPHQQSYIRAAREILAALSSQRERK